MAVTNHIIRITFNRSRDIRESGAVNATNATDLVYTDTHPLFVSQGDDNPTRPIADRVGVDRDDVVAVLPPAA